MTIHEGKENRLQDLIRHRRYYYEQALQKLIDGKVPVEYVVQRAEKLKEVERARH